MKRILVITLLIIGLCAAAWSQASSAKDLNQIYKKGIKAHQDKDYVTFLQCFETLDKLRPNHPLILYNLAGAYSLNNKKNEAIRCLKKLIVIDANPKIASDSDFNFIRESEEFKHILKQIESLNKPISTSEVAFTIKDRHLHPESIAYDPMKKIFYLSSVHKRKIVYIDKDGSVRDFTTPARDGLDAVLGIRIDAQNRVLWAASSAFPQMTGYNEKQDKGRTAVFKYHLDTKKLIKKYVLHEEPNQNHGFDDVVIHPNGDVYISDTRQIYRIPVKSGQLEPFLQHKEFLSMQGLDFCDNGKKILAADWVKGLYLIDIKTKKVLTKVGHPENISLTGIDGLYYLKEGNSLIAIQNGIKPLRVMRFYFSKDFSRVVDYKIIERANPAFNEPTLGVVVNREEFYYIGNSQWKGYTKDFKILPFEKLQDIIIFKTAINY